MQYMDRGNAFFKESLENMEIIVRGSRSKSGKISKENKQEHRWEQRAKMLSNRGYSVGNIHAMMDSGTGKFPARRLEKMIKHKVSAKEMKLNGEHI